MKRILMIIGSLRRDSFNKQLADVVTEMMAGVADVSVLEYSDLPLMNQDMEYPAPEAVSRVRREVKEADGIWIFSPEYNYQIPGGLKNLLDWLSRPMDPNDRNRETVVVKGKYVTISSVAGGSSGAGVRKNLSELLEVMAMNVVGGQGTGVSLDRKAFTAGKLSLSDEKKEELKKQVELFLKEV